MQKPKTIAYLSMEMALHPSMPTYSGGLGVLAGDTVLSAADMRVRLVALTLLHRKGYFYQHLDEHGWQREEPVEWAVADFLQEMPQRVTVSVENRTVHVRAWKYEVEGCTGFKVPVFLLDTDLPENDPWDRGLTNHLYGGDAYYRLCQEMVLGIGGVRMLRALGYDDLDRFHLNEGHASLLVLELLDEQTRAAGRDLFTEDDQDKVSQRCVFTTHTPVPAGHDRFPMDLAKRVLGRPDFEALKALAGSEGMFNLTRLALNLSHYVNGVAHLHAAVSRTMLDQPRIDAITNGVHAATWTSPPFEAVFDRYLPGWKKDNFSLRYGLSIPQAEIWKAHQAAKWRLLQRVNRECNAGLTLDTFTLGFARRAASYKRADLLFQDVSRLRDLAARAGGLQVIYAGKAHPHDSHGKELIHRIFEARDALRPAIRIAYLSNYDTELAKLLVAGVDVWLNTPLPPMEASGTSGMKAALNGVPSLSVLDGWWIEGCIEGTTGWAIGERGEAGTTGEDRLTADADSLYTKLEHVVIPLFYRERDRFVEVMRHAIALNGSFFNTQRMVQQYVLKAYAD
jgi:starch phosphorylase